MLNDLEEKKYHVLNRKQKILIGIALSFFLLIITPIFSYFYYTFAVNRPNQTEKEVAFEIKKGQNLSIIADNLHNEGAVNSKFLFNFYARANRLDRNIQAGMYVIRAGTSVKELVEQFQHGTFERSITFLEGWRVEEFARRADEEFENVTYENFLTLADSYEGYLFPDTYFFNEDVGSEEIINHMRDVFDKKTSDLLSDKSLKRSGLTANQAVIFASIVERESRNTDDRSIVAGILIKRFEEDMKIEADATTQYAVAESKIVNPIEDSWWHKELTLSDLSNDSPYNTRKNMGLPPTPISSISISSLESVINYTLTDYYFYLNDDEGNTHFAVTLEEHNENISKYLTN